MKAVYMPWQRPQFGVTVLNMGRVVMQELVYRMIDADKKVWYANTDSLLILRGSESILPVGQGLGEFQLEYEMSKFICLSPKKWLRVLRNGKIMNSFGKPSEEWFDAEFSSISRDNGRGRGGKNKAHEVLDLRL
jgi:hypothetical protein